MRACSVSAAVLLFAVYVSAYLVDPDTTASPDTIEDCSYWVVVSSSDTCDSIESDWGVTSEQFLTYNPSVGTGCSLITGNSYCIEENFGHGSTLTSSIQQTPTGVSTPVPVQTGMISSCNAFYFVKQGDQCAAIATTYGISLDNFYSWNPAVGSTCLGLQYGEYVCVGITAGNGIPTPTPIQPGMVGNCNKFYLVVANDQCGTIASTQGVAFSDFYLWNAGLTSTCSNLGLGNYVCIGITGMATTKPPTTTTSTGNGISTPTPIQPGMVGNCNKFYLVVANDQCGTIASTHGITLANFYLWNAGLTSTCGNLGLGDYVCISIVGAAPVTSTPAATVTVISSATYKLPPGPTSTGTTPQCKTWYTVQSGDTCDVITAAYGISRSQLVIWNSNLDTACDNLVATYSVCVSSPLVFSYWSSLGCYLDSATARTLATQIVLTNQETTMTVELCQQTCLKSGYKFAGLEYAHQCWCANAIKNNGLATSGCSSACPGNTAETCGGSDRINVYGYADDTSLGCYVDSTAARTLIGSAEELP